MRRILFNVKRDSHHHGLWFSSGTRFFSGKCRARNNTSKEWCVFRLSDCVKFRQIAARHNSKIAPQLYRENRTGQQWAFVWSDTRFFFRNCLRNNNVSFKAREIMSSLPWSIYAKVPRFPAFFYDHSAMHARTGQHQGFLKHLHKLIKQKNPFFHTMYCRVIHHDTITSCSPFEWRGKPLDARLLLIRLDRIYTNVFTFLCWIFRSQELTDS